MLGIPLPEDYKAFVTKYGESHFSQIVQVRPIESPPDHISSEGLFDFSSFYGSDGDGDGLFTHLQVLKGRMPETMLPIGRDFSGNVFCLGVGAKDRNKVYLWDFEGEPAAEDYTEQGLAVPANLWYQNLTLVANSFTDFIDRFEKEPGDG